MKLHDKVAVITGGNSGIGLAIAREFKENGAKIAIFSCSRATLEQAARSFASFGSATATIRSGTAQF